MATTHTLKAETRATVGSGKLNQLRKSGFIPAVVYGVGCDNINIQVDAREFAQMFSEASSEHFLVNLQIDGAAKLALLKEVQHNALSGENVHIDFLAVNDNTEINSVVPVVLTGEAAGVAQGGLLDQHVYELHIHCKVKDLPEVIEVDVKSLGLGQVLHLSEVKLPKGVTTPVHGDTPVAVIEATAAASVAE